MPFEPLWARIKVILLCLLAGSLWHPGTMDAKELESRGTPRPELENDDAPVRVTCRRSGASLERLLVGVTSDSIHRDLPWGEPCGDEVW
ncbi:hypothetical protein ACVWZX_000827 [Deinococcus sp. UYEF24]